jgi:acetyl esterase/lipase
VSLVLRVALSALSRPATSRFGPDPSQVADLHLPRGPGPHPVVVLLHGGHWRTGHGKLTCRPLARDLARRGFAAWNVEYRRLGDGRGGGGGWPATFEDVAAGIDSLAEVAAPLDLSRVTLVGHSAGGQLALWAAARPRLPGGAVGASPRVVARRVVGLAPVTDLRRSGRYAELLVGAGRDEAPGRWAVADPLQAGAPGVPVLLVHPSGDATIPVGRSRAYAQATGAQLLEPAGGHRDPIDPTSEAWAAAVAWLEQG